MGRKPLNDTEREQKRLFDEELKKHSLDALKNIWKIANSAMDAKVRLQANQWLVEKTYGKDYQLFREEQEQQSNEMNINLVIVKPKQNQIRETIIDDETLDITNDDEEWIRYDDTDDWGEQDIYKPHQNSL